MTDFYVHLQSDSSWEHFPNNKISNFKNYISNPINVDPEIFDVALVECSYTYSDAYVQKGEILFKLEKNSTIKIIRAVNDIHTVEQLITSLNVLEEVQFFYENERVRIEYTPEKLTFNVKIASKLGISSRVLKKENAVSGKHIGHLKIFLPSGETKLFIYSDVVRPSAVGDGFSPLLRIAPYKGKELATTIQEYRHLQYMRIAKANLDYIHIYILTESGTPPPLQSGTFSVTLHFKARSY